MISLDRQAYLAKEIINGLGEHLEVDNKDRAVKIAKRAIEKFASSLSDIDTVVKQKIASIKRGVMEGTSEWKALYDKFYSEEVNKK